MDKLIIEGGRRLEGDVQISGAKNAALPCLAAFLLVESGQAVLENVPQVVDIRTMTRLLQSLGLSIEMDGPIVRAAPGELKHWEAPYDLVRTMRASVLVLGPLVGRYGFARVSFPGG